jgi:hypothetical protein
MAVFQWVGGYTGYTGVGSGYSADWGGSGNAVWVSPWNGLTSQRGDIHFAPYYWGFVQNWAERLRLSKPGPDGTLFELTPATRLPRGGDEVNFGLTGFAGTTTTHQPWLQSGLLNHSISLLFGGCSGPSAMWHGYTAGSGGLTPITFVMTSNWLDTPWERTANASGVLYTRIGVTSGPLGTARYTQAPNGLSGSVYHGFHVGMIGWNSGFTADVTLAGVTGNIVQTDDGIDPLDIRFTHFGHLSSKAKSYIRNVGSTGNVSISIGPYQTFYPQSFEGGPTNDGELHVCGPVQYAYQRHGRFHSLDWNGDHLVLDRLTVENFVVGTYLSEDTTVNEFVKCSPNYVRDSIDIHCAVPTLYLLQEMNVLFPQNAVPLQGALAGGWAVVPPRMIYNLGDRTGTATPTIGTLLTEAKGGSGINGYGESTPKINMFSFTNDTLQAYNGYFKPADVAGKAIYPIFRDGFLRGNTLIDMNHPFDPDWTNGLIGYSPSDEGLRIDSLNARIIFALGDNVIINGKDNSRGLT